MRAQSGQSEIALLTLAGIFCLMIAAGLMAGCPVYNVWQQGLAGQAAFKRAEQDRQITVQEAIAKRDAAVELAAAEITRAEGVAKANKIIGESLKGHDEYLRYLWIVDVAGAGTGKTVVYVPTEANLPILEAGKRE